MSARAFELMRMTVVEFARQASALRSGDMWLVPDDAAAQRLTDRRIFRSRIWTAAKLVDVTTPRRIIAALIASIWVDVEDDDIVAELV